MPEPTNLISQTVPPAGNPAPPAEGVQNTTTVPPAGDPPPTIENSAWIKELYGEEGVPEDLNNSVRGFTDAKDALTKYSELQKKMSETRAKPIPETSEDYTYKQGERDPVVLDDAQMKDIRKDFHEKGFSDEEFSFVMDYYMKQAGKGMQIAQALGEETAKNTTTQLQAEYGKDYDITMQKDRATMDKLGLTDFLVEKGLANDVQTWQAIHKITQSLSEDAVSGKPSNMTYKDRITQINTQLGNMKVTDPRYQNLAKSRELLYEQAYPGG